MDEHIDMNNPLCRTYWCGNFSCSDAELVSAVHIMDKWAWSGSTWPHAAQNSVTSISMILPWTLDG